MNLSEEGNIKLVMVINCTDGKTDIKISTMATAKLKADKTQLMCLLVRVFTVCIYQTHKNSHST